MPTSTVHPRFPHLFSPVTIAGCEIRNRVGISAHFAGWWADDGLPTEDFAAYVEERAKGGIGLFVVGATAVRYDGGPTWLQNLDERIIPGYRMLAEAAQRHGTRLFAQLIHRGDHPLPGAPVIAPAPRTEALPPTRRMPVPPPRSIEDLRDIIQCFAQAASRAQEGGADGVEVHSHESFLHAQLLSPIWSRREDEFGGSLENRMRFLVETLQAIRAAVGPGYPLGVRLKADDMAAGGMGPEDYQEAVRRLEALGLVDYLSVTGGDGALHHGPFPRPDGEWLALAGALRAGTRLPLMHAGRITTPEMAEQAVAEGRLDLALLTKAHIADPHFTLKAFDGRLDEIRYCTRCLQSCIGKMEQMTCIYNPVTSREREWAELEPAARKKRVVVVGAGPAGMEAALTASQRGHEVIVLEQSGQVGGQVRYASRSPLRAMFGRIWEFYERQARRGLFEVRLNTTAALDTVLALHPDAVLIASGSVPRRAVIPAAPEVSALPLIDAAERDVLTVHEALDGAADGAKRVVVADREGGMRALVAADYLSERGAAVDFVTPFPTLCPGVNAMTLEELHRWLRERGVRFSPAEDAAAWSGDDLLLRNAFTAAERRLEQVDAVVVADGSESVNDLGLALRGRVEEIHVIGDANLPKGVEEATYQGGRLGRLL
jgi:2,4-dienoyl-CoA reductase-like NADH-dependent reductase (Old Yellow Enzyme family)/thioredoxin reductase